MKFVVIIILLLINARETSSMMNLTLINNARFDSMNLLDDLWDIPTRDRCICQCDARPNCILVNYNGFHQECQLFSALLQSEKLRVVPINENAAVIVFNYRNQIGRRTRVIKIIIHWLFSVTSTVYQTTSTSTTTTTTGEETSYDDFLFCIFCLQLNSARHRQIHFTLTGIHQGILISKKYLVINRHLLARLS